MINALHLLWICPLCAVLGIFLTAICAGAYDAHDIVEAMREDENPEFYPAAPSESVDIDYYLEGRRPSGLIEED